MRNLKDMTLSTVFTLVELLVVIAVIMLLMALLMPSLKSARDQAKRLACANKLRNVILYTNYYLSDSNEVFFKIQITGGAGVVLWRDYVESVKSGMGSNASGKDSMWWCPASDWTPGSWTNSCKYGSNTHLSYLKLGNVAKPSKTLFAVDETLYNGWHAVNKWTSDLHLWISWLHNGNTANRIFLDGHLSTSKRSEYSSAACAAEFWP